MAQWEKLVKLACITTDSPRDLTLEVLRDVLKIETGWWEQDKSLDPPVVKLIIPMDKTNNTDKVYEALLESACDRIRYLQSRMRDIMIEKEKLAQRGSN
jgi:hypothetical protein